MKLKIRNLKITNFSAKEFLRLSLTGIEILKTASELCFYFILAELEPDFRVADNKIEVIIIVHIAANFSLSY